MNSIPSIIDMWPSAEVFSDDLGLKWRSHGRTMKLRGAIPKAHWSKVLEAAEKRGLPITEADLIAAHAKSESAA